MATATMAAFAPSGSTPAHKDVSGTVRFFQNPFIASDNSRFTIEIVGLPVDTDYWVCLLTTHDGTNDGKADIGAGSSATAPVVNIST